MSIRLMSQVWEKSKQKGSALLLLLALADWSNDEDGSCWAGVVRLAKKARMSERNAQRLLRTLEASGELRVEWGAGKQTVNGATNRYFILTENVTPTGDAAVTPLVTPVSPLPVTPVSPNTSVHTSVHTLDDSRTPSSKQEKPKRESPHSGHYNALIAAFGFGAASMTKTAARPFWTAAAELHSVAFPLERVPALYAYVKRKAELESWNAFTVHALTKYAPDFLAHTRPASARPVLEVPDAEGEVRDYSAEIAALTRTLGGGHGG